MNNNIINKLNDYYHNYLEILKKSFKNSEIDFATFATKMSQADTQFNYIGDNLEALDFILKEDNKSKNYTLAFDAIAYKKL